MSNRSSDKVTFMNWALDLRDRYPNLFRAKHRWMPEINPGWCRIIERLCESVNHFAVLPDCQACLDATCIEHIIPGFSCIKQKLGRLDVYLTRFKDPDVRNAFYAEIHKAQAEAEVTCEECGQPGRPTSIGGYLCVMCESCEIISHSEWEIVVN